MLTTGEISKGMFVTVIDNKPFERNIEGMFGQVEVVAQTDRSGFGDVFEVMAVDLPYVALRYMHGCAKDCVTKFDTRRSTFKELSKDYIEAFNK